MCVANFYGFDAHAEAGIHFTYVGFTGVSRAEIVMKYWAVKCSVMSDVRGFETT
jgi:hypothetical protein